jgi:hypothetical protein
MLARPPKSELAARRARNRAKTAAWRDRNRRGVALYTIEVDSEMFDLAQRVGLLGQDETDERAIADAVAKLLRLALAVLREHRHL